MSVSLVYRNAWIYDLAMRMLYGRFYAERYRAIDRLIPDGASVLEVCCGPGFLYERCLRKRGVRYTGLDVNPAFVCRIERLGGRGILHDVTRDEPLPPADYVIVQASLYQFLPDALPVVERMIAAAATAMVVAEPVRNLASSRVPVLARLARRATNAGQGPRSTRFTERSLAEFAALVRARLKCTLPIPGGREHLYVWDTARTPIGSQEAPMTARDRP